LFAPARELLSFVSTVYSMPASQRGKSSTPIPTTETAEPSATADHVASTVTEEEWTAMTTVLTNVAAHRTEE